VGEMVGERRGGDTVRETVGETVAKLRWKHQRECVNATTETACSMFQRFLMTLFRHPQPPPGTPSSRRGLSNSRGPTREGQTCRELSLARELIVHDSRPHGIRRGAGDLLFPLPCQRSEGALAGGRRSSCPRAGAEARARACSHNHVWARGRGRRWGCHALEAGGTPAAAANLKPHTEASM
jgi:hypothetical protein